MFEEVVKNKLSNLFGKSCCRQRVGIARSLIVGFGDRVPRKNKIRLNDEFKGEWELGTFSAEWCVSYLGSNLCSSRDFIEQSLLELDEKLNKITFGKIEAIDFVSKSHVRVRLDGNIIIDFLASTKQEDENEDEFFHVFCPNSEFIACSLQRGWFFEKNK